VTIAYSSSGNSRRAAMDNGESARPMERACTMSSLVTSTHLPHARIPSICTTTERRKALITMAA
jgi:hypothetical protein